MRRSVLVLVAFFAISAPAAFACNDPSLGGVTSIAGPGDRVSFSAVHLDPGASYSVTVAGRGVASGTASGGTISGSFSMPDLGATGVVYVELRVEHDDATWISTEPIQFAAATPPRAANPKTPAGLRQQPVTIAAPPPTSKTQGTAQPKPAASTAPPRAADLPTAAAAGRAATQYAKPTVRQTTPVARKWAVVPPAHRAHRAAVRKHLRQRVRTSPSRQPPMVAHAPREPVTAERQAQPRVAGAPHRHPDVPLWILAACALALAAFTGYPLARLRARKAAARMHELQVEAELQELIAEARAHADASLRAE